MINQQFWQLIGGVSAALAGFGFIGLTFFDARAKESFPEISQYGLKELDPSISVSKMVINLSFFILPLFLAITTITNNQTYLVVYLLFYFCFVSQRKLQQIEIKNKIKQVQLPGIILITLVALSLISSVVIKNLSPQPNATIISPFDVLEFLAIISLGFGLIFSIQSLLFFIRNKSIFKITDSFWEYWERQLVKIDIKLKRQFEIANNYPNDAEGKGMEKIMEMIEERLSRISRQVRNLGQFEPPQNMTFTEIKDYETDFKNLNTELDDIQDTLKKMMKASTSTS